MVSIFFFCPVKGGFNILGVSGGKMSGKGYFLCQRVRDFKKRLHAILTAVPRETKTLSRASPVFNSRSECLNTYN